MYGIKVKLSFVSGINVCYKINGQRVYSVFLRAYINVTQNIFENLLNQRLFENLLKLNTELFFLLNDSFT